ncbi:MAG: hypothetical protein H6707_20695 [Deltaproteobacteria bacterium]|nr:hypothetical protein [Deltaproteobacteria bacterium]
MAPLPSYAPAESLVLQLADQTLANFKQQPSKPLNLPPEVKEKMRALWDSLVDS